MSNNIKGFQVISRYRTSESGVVSNNVGGSDAAVVFMRAGRVRGHGWKPNTRNGHVGIRATHVALIALQSEFNNMLGEKIQASANEIRERNTIVVRCSIEREGGGRRRLPFEIITCNRPQRFTI
jgi:hypothetical protein